MLTISFDINYFLIVGASVLNMLIGWLWYSPYLFGNTWMKLINKKPEDFKSLKDELTRSYLLTFLGSILMSFVFAQILRTASAFSFLDGSFIGFWIWLGFVAPIQLMDTLFSDKQNGVFFINTGYPLISLLIIGGLLSVLG